jgi:hypothetical protein
MWQECGSEKGNFGLNYLLSPLLETPAQPLPQCAADVPNRSPSNRIPSPLRLAPGRGTLFAKSPSVAEFFGDARVDVSDAEESETPIK